ncbi:MAG: FtsW/RodA/SpoVE family cell cycle protein [Limnochordales bacterium]|nr:FtsW/RodA/SpoVE family cell cycle protein [Limnochordales bacterium]
MNQARRTELRLLLLGLTAPLLAGLELTHASGEWDRPRLLIMGGYVALFIAVHLIQAVFRSDADPVVLPLMAFLTGISLVALTRLNPELAQRQLLYLALALAGFTVASLWRGYPLLRRIWLLAALGGLVLTALTLVDGVQMGGARAWLRWGTFQFQPVEPVKLLLLVSLAAAFSPGMRGTQGSTNTTSTLPGRWTIVYVLLLVGMMALQRDLGGALLIMTLFALLTLTVPGGGRLLLPVGATAVLLLVAAYFNLPYVTVRVRAWLAPWSDPHGAGYQVLQSLYALGSGGLFGSGLGAGLPDRIPAASTDYVLAAWGEEGGFLGLLPVLVALLLLAVRGLSIAIRRSRDDPFLGRLAAGLALLPAAQGFIIGGGIVRLIPLTGLPFPLVSYGGTSLVVNGVALGVLLGLSRTPKETPAGAGDEGENSSNSGSVYLERRVAGLARGVVAAYLALVLGFSYWQVICGPLLAARPENPRLVARTLSRPRGGIYDRLDQPLAEPITNATLLTDHKEGGAPPDLAERRGIYKPRQYHVDPTFGPHIGYVDPRLGLGGLEAAYDNWLTGEERSVWTTLRIPRAPVGTPGHLYLTIDRELQSLAGRLLRGRKGAVVVMNPYTGALYVLASSPGFDPGRVGDEWEKLRDDPDQPLFPRAVKGRYAPGSAWKPLVLAAALESGMITGQEVFEDEGAVIIEGNRIANAGQQAFGRIGIDAALARSSNVVFAQIGSALPEDVWKRYLAPIVTWEGVDVDRQQLPVTAGNLPTEWSRVARAEMGIGQGQLALSPLALAMGISAIANGGNLVVPYLVEEAVSPSGAGYREQHPPPRRLFSVETAERVRQAMLAVVREGTGRRAALPGVKVAGKTGTAYGPGGREDAWFVGFAPAERPRAVVVVVIEGGGAGGSTAAPIARELLAAALAQIPASAAQFPPSPEEVGMNW